MQVPPHPAHPPVAHVACFGSSGTCTHVAHNVIAQSAGRLVLDAYIEDDAAAPTSPYDGLPIVELDDIGPDVGVIVPVHGIAARRRIYARLEERGTALIGSSGSARIAHPSAVLGEGVIVSSETFLGPGTTVGRGSIVLAGLVAHDVVIGEFCTLAMRSIVLGHVVMGDDVWVGAGATISNGTADRPLRIGDGAVIGVGAVVDRDVAPGEVLTGPRAMTLREWARLRLAARGPRR